MRPRGEQRVYSKTHTKGGRRPLRRYRVTIVHAAAEGDYVIRGGVRDPTLAFVAGVVGLQTCDNVRIGQRCRVAQNATFGDVAQQATHDLATARLG
jgi:hypothetical protein